MIATASALSWNCETFRPGLLLPSVGYSLHTSLWRAIFFPLYCGDLHLPQIFSQQHQRYAHNWRNIARIVAGRSHRHRAPFSSVSVLSGSHIFWVAMIPESYISLLLEAFLACWLGYRCQIVFIFWMFSQCPSLTLLWLV